MGPRSESAPPPYRGGRSAPHFRPLRHSPPHSKDPGTFFPALRQGLSHRRRIPSPASASHRRRLWSRPVRASDPARHDNLKSASRLPAAGPCRCSSLRPGLPAPGSVPDAGHPFPGFRRRHPDHRPQPGFPGRVRTLWPPEPSPFPQWHGRDKCPEEYLWKCPYPRPYRHPIFPLPYQSNAGHSPATGPARDDRSDDTQYSCWTVESSGFSRTVQVSSSDTRGSLAWCRRAAGDFRTNRRSCLLRFWHSPPGRSQTLSCPSRWASCKGPLPHDPERRQTSSDRQFQSLRSFADECGLLLRPRGVSGRLRSTSPADPVPPSRGVDNRPCNRPSRRPSSAPFDQRRRPCRRWSRYQFPTSMSP